MSEGLSSPERLRMLRERLGLGLEVIRAHRLRSALLVLGVAIGVAALMAMVAVLAGLGEKIAADISNTGRVVIYIAKFDLMVGGGGGGGDGEDLFDRPDVTPADATAVERLCPAVDQADYYIEPAGRFILLRHRGRRTRPAVVIGTGSRFQEFYSIPIGQGRDLVEADVERRRRVCVVGHGPGRDLFPDVDPVGKRIRIDEVEYEVVGTFAERRAITGEWGENFVAVPYTTYLKDWKQREDMGYVMLTVAPGARAADAMEAARAVMRARRGLKPGEDDDFAIFGTDAVQRLVDRVTGPVALVLVLISSIGLLVGGIGVMNLMLVSVAQRTHEIGIRKAVGARRRDILLEVLGEAGTLTGLGGLAGVGLGALAAWGIGAATGFPVAVRPAMVAIAVLFSVGIGLFFGLYPADRAARLDPVVALRQE